MARLRRWENSYHLPMRLSFRSNASWGDNCFLELRSDRTELEILGDGFLQRWRAYGAGKIHIICQCACLLGPTLLGATIVFWNCAQIGRSLKFLAMGFYKDGAPTALGKFISFANALVF